MAKNTIKGKNKRPGSNKATGRDYSKQKKYNATPKQIAKRVELNRINREKGTYGNKDGKDVSHKSDGSTIMESQSKNRARKGRIPVKSIAKSVSRKKRSK